jgi:hypothetical protein
VNDDLGLFPEPERAAEPAAEPTTAGQRLRQRQANRIARGLHPLAYGGAVIRLHPDASRDPTDRTGAGPRCGGCQHRWPVGGHARDYPKCVLGYARTPLPPERIRPGGPTHRVTWPPRATAAEASDVRAWWPACDQYEPRDSATQTTSPCSTPGALATTTREENHA